MINTDFNLKTLPIKHKVEDSNTYQSNEEEIETRIYPLIRKWFVRDREYWKSLGITLDELNNKNIYPLKSFKVINKKGEEWEFDVENQFSYGLKSDLEGKWKIKQPYNKKCKWISNIPNSHIEKYKGSDKRVLLITKSRNDCIIWDKITNCDKWVLQSEKIPLSNEDIIEINKTYELVIVCLDNDPTGLEYSDKLVKQIRSKFKAALITTKETIPTIAENHKQGILCLYGFASDQSPKKNAAYHWAPFMGHIVPVHTGAEMLAKRFDMNVIFLRTKKIKRGYYEASFELLSNDAKSVPNYDITDRFLQLVEEQIREAPEFYLWTHKRWKYMKN